METSLHNVPSDVLRVILRCAQSHPSTLGVLGRVCRDLYTKINGLEDIWELLAATTPDVAGTALESSSGGSNVAACRLKLNRFAAVVKKMKLGQGNVTSVRESYASYVPKQQRLEERKRRQAAADGQEEQRDDDDDDEQGAYFDDSVSCSFEVLHNVGSNKFTLITKEEMGGSSWMFSNVSSVREYNIKDPLTAETDFPIDFFSPENYSSPQMVGDRFITMMEDDMMHLELKCFDKISMTRMVFDLSDATSSPSPVASIILNRDKRFPWVMVHCIGVVEGYTGNGRMMRGGLIGSAVNFRQERHSIAIFDLCQGIFIVKDKPIRVQTRYRNPAVFSANHIVIAEPHAESGDHVTSCYEIDVELGEIRLLWKLPLNIEVWDLNSSVAWVSIEDYYYMISMKDGRKLIDFEFDLKELGTIFNPSRVTFVTGRFFQHGNFLYDVFNRSTPIFYTPWPHVTIFSEGQWLVDDRFACYAVDFESQYQEVGTSLVGCALGEASIGDRLQDGSSPVDCHMTRVEIPVSGMLQFIASSLGCVEQDLVCTRYNFFRDLYVFPPVRKWNFRSPVLNVILHYRGFVFTKRSDAGMPLETSGGTMTLLAPASDGSQNGKRPMVPLNYHSTVDAASHDRYANITWQERWDRPLLMRIKPLESVPGVKSIVLCAYSTHLRMAQPMDAHTHLQLWAAGMLSQQSLSDV
jgi:hypothetical protein